LHLVSGRPKGLAKAILPPPLYKKIALGWYYFGYYYNQLFGYNEFYIDNDYERYWAKRLDIKSHGLYTSRRIKKFREIIKLVERNSSVLEIGCGDGILLELLIKEKLAASDVLGIDISEHALNACRTKGIKVKRIDAFCADFIKDLGVFDYLIMADFIEHIVNSELLLKLIKQKIKKGIIISLPNTGFFLYRLRLLFGKFPMQWARGEFIGVHLRFWTLRDFKWWIDRLDFMVKDFLPVQGIPLLKKIWPNLFCSVMIFLVVNKSNTEVQENLINKKVFANTGLEKPIVFRNMHGNYRNMLHK